MKVCFKAPVFPYLVRAQALAAFLTLAACDDDAADSDAGADAAVTDAAATDAQMTDAPFDGSPSGSDGSPFGLDANPFEDPDAAAGPFARVCAPFNPAASAGGLNLRPDSAIGWRVLLQRRARIQRLAVSVETADPTYQEAGMPELTLGLVRLDGPNDAPKRPLLTGTDTVIARAVPLPRTREETVLEVRFTDAEAPVLPAGWYALIITTNVGNATWAPLTVPLQDPVPNTKCQDNTYPFSVPDQGALVLQSASPYVAIEGELL